MSATQQQSTDHTDAPGAIGIEKYFRAMAKAGASDLHIKPGAPPHVRVKLQIRPTAGDPLTEDETATMAYELMSDLQRALFEQHGSVDVAHDLPDGDRFRVNVFRQRGSVCMAIRRVTKEIPSFEALHLPDVVAQIANEHQGLVLLSGPAGGGKSTTIAAIIESINQSRPCHIITIEDPIEYLFEDKKALVSQREIGIDVATFELAMKYLLREDPDVVLIGEMRDRDTFQSALRAAETGHLVFGTVHAASAAQTVGRILHLFSPDERSAYRQILAMNLRVVVCQMLIPSVCEEFDRVPAVEVLQGNSTVRQLIREERDDELDDVIRANEPGKMLSFTRSLLGLIEKNYIDPKVAYEIAPNAEKLKMLIKGIDIGQTGLASRD